MLQNILPCTGQPHPTKTYPAQNGNTTVVEKLKLRKICQHEWTSRDSLQRNRNYEKKKKMIFYIFIIKKMKFQTTSIDNITLSRIDIIIYKGRNNAAVRMWSNWNSNTLRIGMWNGTVSLKESFHFLKRVKQTHYMTQQFHFCTSTEGET